MAEEKNILEQAKEMLGSKMADAGNLMESAKSLVGDKDGDGDVDLDDVKKSCPIWRASSTRLSISLRTS